MARPPRFDTDQLLDAAVALAAAGGPAAVTMSAVAQAVGAPSGSVYHRVAGRPARHAEVWVRSVEGVT
ncbi:TetR family transcriptional regulator, partial [Streptomyces goshikiensis]